LPILSQKFQNSLIRFRQAFAGREGWIKPAYRRAAFPLLVEGLLRGNGTRLGLALRSIPLIILKCFFQRISFLYPKINISEVK